MSEADADVPVIYTVRISTRASREITEAMLHIADETGDDAAALEWKNGCYAEAGKLATFPRSYPLSSEVMRAMPRTGAGEVRQMLYRLKPGGVAYRLFFSVTDEGEDGPLVRVLHVRHASRRPPSRTEARGIIAAE